ncbi:XdhC family protein [Nitrosococcus wardiae]|uniref:XdhC family protein n=1 Tax=Nitrosococcus wardiae TaxID=1814290 RepID=A0A4P7C2L6_9GAMM|nr:XdhC family protein [Nitrosococcus wardiae]QBQ55910.1 XdhC family protein [Nitrosococcus wardiae]
MNNVHQEILQRLVRWLAAGQHGFLVTVVKTWGSSLPPISAQLAVSSKGRSAGSLFAGWVEEDLRKRLPIESPCRPEIITYGANAEPPRNRPLPCEGTLQLVIEPVRSPDSLKQILAAIERREVVCRHLDMGSGYAETFPGQPDSQLHFNGKTLITIYSPRWRLLLIGATAPAHYLAQMALALEYEVIVCEPRPEYAHSWDLPGTELRTRVPGDIVKEFALDPCSAMVAMTHDPKLDEMALGVALESEIFYVGALGAPMSNEHSQESPAHRFEWTPVQLSRLHTPAGLPINAHTPAEIALSILAEITALRHAREHSITTSTKQALATGHDKYL